MPKSCKETDSATAPVTRKLARQPRPSSKSVSGPSVAAKKKKSSTAAENKKSSAPEHKKN